MYVMKLAQYFEKLAPQILWKCLKHDFLDNEANFQSELLIFGTLQLVLRNY